VTKSKCRIKYVFDICGYIVYNKSLQQICALLTNLHALFAQFSSHDGSIDYGNSAVDHRKTSISTSSFKNYDTIKKVKLVLKLFNHIYQQRFNA